MPTTSDYLTQLQQDREDLVDNLETQGITGLTGDETFTELVPEVLNIQTGGGSPNLQTKSVTITTNTTTNISADSGYDGLDSVSVTTNVSGGSNPTKGVVITDWNNSGQATEVTLYGFNENNYINMPRNGVASGDGFNQITKAILDNTCTSLPEKCFSGATLLNTIDIKNKISYLSPNAFNGCIALTKTSMDWTKINATDIPPSCFTACTSLNITELPNTIINIGQFAFSGCTNLSLTSLPTNLTSIGYAETGTGGYTFNGCTNLKISEIPESVQIVNNVTYRVNLFSNCTNITITKVPNNWTVIPNNCFNGCTSIPSMNLSTTSVTIVGTSAFSGCTSLANFNFGNVVTINGNAFQSCTSLANIIAENVETIYNQAFLQCTALKKICLPSITSLTANSNNTGQFSRCTSLKQVWLGSGITSAKLGRYVFQYCTSLEKIYIDLPRATVGAFTNYQYAFMNDTSKTGIIVCNDDNDFISQSDFESIDVSTL